VGVTEIYALGKGYINQKIAQGSPTRNGKKYEPKRRGENITNSLRETNVEFTGIYLQNTFEFVSASANWSRQKEEGGGKKYVEGILFILRE